MTIKDRPQYQVYIMKLDELLITLFLAMGLCFCVGLLFYNSVLLSVLFSFVGILYIPLRRKEQLTKRKQVIHLQFKDALYFLSVSLTAGKSLETALMDTQKALAGIYSGQDCDMLKELEIMNGRILMNDTVENAFYDLAERSGIEDIKSFADVLTLSKRAGANLVEVIKNTSETIREKIEIRQEIENLISGKKLEQKVLSVMPFAMVFLLRSSSSDFLDPLMNTTFGHVVMTAALALILIGLVIGHKVMQIEV